MKSFKAQFLKLMQNVANDSNLKIPYINLAQYKGNHFLKTHDDIATTDYGDRAIAFTLHMTPS